MAMMAKSKKRIMGISIAKDTGNLWTAIVNRLGGRQASSSGGSALAGRLRGSTGIPDCVALEQDTQTRMPVPLPAI
jgi:hypothetical protein